MKCPNSFCTLQCPRNQPLSSLFQKKWHYHFSFKIHISPRPGTGETALWPFIKSELPIDFIQGQRLLTAELLSRGPRRLRGSSGFCVGRCSGAGARVSLPQAARRGPRGALGPRRGRSNWRARSAGSQGRFRAPGRRAAGGGSVPRRPASSRAPVRQ